MAGAPVTELCRRHGISQASFYKWRQKFGGLEVNEANTLYDCWPKLPPGDKCKAVEALINEKIVIGDGDIDITLSHLPSFEEMCKGQQKPWPG